jgi:hypothetical protein
MDEARIVDANALARELLSLTYLGCDGGYYKGVADERDATLKRIADAPTITPESLGYKKEVRGRWIQHYETTTDNETVLYGWECSECGRWEMDREPYCNCGAKMEDKPCE